MELIDLADMPNGKSDFVGHLRNVCESLGLEYASYASTHPLSGTVHAFTTYPDRWKNHYMEHGLHLQDPTLEKAARSIAPVDWGRLERSANFQSVFSQAYDFGLPDTGVTIPVRGPFGEVGLFSVSAPLPTDGWQKLRTQIIGNLQSSAVYLHDAVMTSETVMKSLRFPHLSSREKEILQWVAAGKSQQDIGDILSISLRTVEVHLRSTREKLFALTTAQAVGRGISLGLITPS
ncbi:Transcriptional activator protein LasR [Roseovarius albus]|uniref:Transcriptional activator protein LasR n=1 Tax=Roseovarius albus TaxID=1247867 RepID=A0A1X6ZAC3_9RHOB|nr:autoinducer binding domain-containing protein [Roseovarius albus]SLN45856.1 Transcriptional activator protein LasR [Roseovarius albus]